MVFVPARFAADSILEAAEAGITTIIAITEGIPAHDELRVNTHLKRSSGVRLIGPNCPGVLSPGKANVGIIPADFFKEGNVGVVSRSGTLTYQIGNELAQSGFGNSSIVGIGGDPVPGSSFIDVLELFEADPETELIVMAGEIGGSAEEEAAEYIADNVTKPVVAYIAGFTAPPGKTMGHAGAIVSGTSRAPRRPRPTRSKPATVSRRAHADRGLRHRRRAAPRLTRGRCCDVDIDEGGVPAEESRPRRGLFRWLFSGDGWPYLLLPFIPMAVALELAHANRVADLRHLGDRRHPDRGADGPRHRGAGRSRRPGHRRACST